MARKRCCNAPDMLGKLHCERAHDHRGRHAWTDPSDGRVYRWGPRSGPSGPTQSTEARAAKGLTRLSPAWLSPEAEARRAAFAARLGSTRAALEWALTQAPLPPKPR